tara:strand:+ start:50 stop:808 length:759 start_codon:yes stop_codon:yes gene_type:complete
MISINEKIKLSFELYTWEKIKEIYSKKKFENVILFSQPRSGSTFVSNVFAKELNYFENFYPEEFFLDQHFVYLKSFIKKKNKFFININEYWVKRPELQKKNTMYLYLYRSSKDILDSYEKAKKFNYYLGWSEMIDKYRKFFPEIKDFQTSPLFGHQVWEKQINKFDNAFTLSYESFQTHKFFLKKEIREEKIRELKNIEIVENKHIERKITPDMKGVIPKEEKDKLGFNFFEKTYFFIRRKLESKKRNRKNY